MTKKLRAVISSFIAAAMTVSVLPSVFAADTVALYDDFSSYEEGTYITLNNSNWGQVTEGSIIAAVDPQDPSNIVGKYTGANNGDFVTLRKSTQLDDPLIISGRIMLLHDAATFTLGLRDQVGSPNMAYISSKRLYMTNSSGGGVNTGITVKTNEWIYFAFGLRSNADPTQSKTYIKLWGNGVDNAGSSNGYAEGVVNLENAKLTDTLVRFDSQAERVLFDDIKMLNAPTFDITMPENTNITGSSITLDFNHEINPGTLDASKISVTNNANSSPVSVTGVTVAEDLMSAEVTFGSALASNAVYKVELANDVYDIAHSRPANNLYFSTDGTEPPVSEQLPVLVDGIKIEPSQLDLKLGFEERFTGKNLYTPDTLCQLKYTIYPQTADNQKLEWFSDNEEVVTIDKDTGNIRTVGEGTTTVYAQATDGSGVVSAKTTVNVGPGYDTETQQMCLSDTDTPRIDTEEYLSWPTEIGDPQVALWKDNNTGAFSVTIDDGISGDFDRWIAMSEKYGFEFTFFIPGITLEQANMKEPVQKLIDAGMDVSSHTYTHVSTEEQGTYTSGWWFEDLGHAARVLKENYGVTAKTVGYSYGTLGPNVLKADNADYMHEYHIAGRGTGGAINPPDTTNYDFIGSESMFGSVKLEYDTGNGQWSSMEGRIKSLYDENYTQSGETHIGGWSNIHSHGIDATGWAQDEDGNQIHAVNPDLGYAATVEEMLTYAFDNYLQPARAAGLVWADTFTNIAIYGQERDTAEVTVTENTADTIKFNVTDKMNDEYFDFPLTIKFKVNDDWEKVGATQNGEPIEVIEKEIDGSKYIMVNAVPDRGEVTVLPNTATTTPTPSATATPTPTATAGATATPAPSATPTATPTAAPTNTPVEGEDYVLLDEDFDGLAADGEVLENKIIRAQNNKNNTSLPTDVWSINATDWTNSNVNANGEPAAFVLPYDSDDNYGAYFYTWDTTGTSGSYARFDYEFDSSTQPEDGDTLIIEGKIKMSEYLNASGNLANSFGLNFVGVTETRPAGNGTKQLMLVRHCIDGPTEVVNGVQNSTRLSNYKNMADDWIYYSVAVTLDNDNLSQCPAYITISGRNDSNTEYYKAGTIDLSPFMDVSNIRAVRYGVTVQKADRISDSGSADDMYHGIYLDDARIIKAGEFKMTSDEGLTDGQISFDFSHAFRTVMSGNNIGAGNFTVSGSDGSTVPVTAADYDIANPTSVTLTLDESAVKPGVTYTISSTVQDVLGNTPSAASFTTEFEAQTPEVSDVVRSDQIFTGNDNDIAYAYTFTVSTNDATLTGLELKITNGINLLEGDLTKEFEIPAVEGSDIKFGIIAGHTLAEGETAEDVTPPEFEAVPIY